MSQILKNKITVKNYAPNLGAVIKGIDLSNEISNSEQKIIRDAFHKYLVIFSRAIRNFSTQSYHTWEMFWRFAYSSSCSKNEKLS